MARKTGLAELIFTHASDYTIILDTASMEPVEETDEFLVADTTGDNTVQAATGFLTLKKRKER